MNDFKEGQSCIICGTGTMHLVEGDEVFEYRGVKTILHVISWKCPVCLEGFFRKCDEDRISAILSEQRLKIDNMYQEKKGDIEHEDHTERFNLCHSD